MAQSNLGRSRTLMAAQLVDATDNAEVVKGFYVGDSLFH